jgi:hypothetical protein
METIKLLLAHCDRQVNNQVEVAVLDVCYERASVQSTRTSRLDEFVHQGSLWDFDLIVVGGDNLFLDRAQRSWATPEQVAKGIQSIRAQSSAPIIAIARSPESSELFLGAGAEAALSYPLEPEQLKLELRSLLDLSGLTEVEPTPRWSGISSLFRGFQRAKATT